MQRADVFGRKLLVKRDIRDEVDQQYEDLCQYADAGADDHCQHRNKYQPAFVFCGTAHRHGLVRKLVERYGDRDPVVFLCTVHFSQSVCDNQVW